MRLGEQDLYFFREGSHARLYRHMGCQVGADGASFRVWAPNAAAVSVIGDWNGWGPDARPLHARADSSGVWEGEDDRVRPGCAYKFRLVGPDGRAQDKADPYAFFAEEPPATASRAWRLDYEWQDAARMARRGERNALSAPMLIYEMHLGSWRRPAPTTLPAYRDIAAPLAEYVREQGFTHVESFACQRLATPGTEPKRRT